MMEKESSFNEIWLQFAENLKQGWSWSGFERSVMFLNDGDANFVNIGNVTGLDQVTDGRSVAVGDIDNDGDMDMVCTSSRTSPHVYVLRNDFKTDRHHLQVELLAQKNTSAAGAKLLLTAGGKTMRRDVVLGSGYSSQRDLTQHFGLGSATSIERLEITWPNGDVQVVNQIATNQKIVVTQGQAEFKAIAHKPHNYNATNRLSKVEWHDHWNRMHLLRQPYINLAGLALEDFHTGESIEISTGYDAYNGNGKVTLLNLWATWCANCAREMPDLVAADADPDSSLRIIGVAMDEDMQPDAVKQVAKAWGIDFPVAYPDQEGRDKIMEALLPLLGESAALAMPTSLLLDPAGNVVGVVQGTITIEDMQLYLEHTRFEPIPEGAPIPEEFGNSL